MKTRQGFMCTTLTLNVSLIGNEDQNINPKINIPISLYPYQVTLKVHVSVHHSSSCLFKLWEYEDIKLVKYIN